MVERELRLRRGGDVRRARGKGRAWADGPLVARVIRNDTDPPQNRYAVVAGKKAGKAVQRNRLKRLVRETIRHHHPRLAQGHDIVVIVRGTVEEMPGLAEAERAYGRIVRRAGLLVEGAAGNTALGSRAPQAAPGGGEAEPSPPVGEPVEGAAGPPRARPTPGDSRGESPPVGGEPTGKGGEPVPGDHGSGPRSDDTSRADATQSDVPRPEGGEDMDPSDRAPGSQSSRPDPESSR